MIAIDLTVLRPLRLIDISMHTPLPKDALDRFTIAELAQILALSRYSRRPVKSLLHAKDLPDNTDNVTQFVASINHHPQFHAIQELATTIDGALSFYARAAAP